MPEETPEQTDTEITVTNGQICTAVVAAYFIFAKVYNFRARAHNRKVLRRLLRFGEQAAANDQTVRTTDDLAAALCDTPTMYFCNN